MNLVEERDFWRSRAMQLEKKRDFAYISTIPMHRLKELNSLCKKELDEWYSKAYYAYKESGMYSKELWDEVYRASIYEDDPIEFWKMRYTDADAKLKTRLLKKDKWFPKSYQTNLS